DGSLYIKQPHQADAFAGIAPQGALAVVGDRLLVPCGRSIPACYDRRTGKLLHFRLADDSKLGGGAEVVARPAYFASGGSAFDLATGAYLGPVGDPVAPAGDALYGCFGTEIRGFDMRKVAPAKPTAFVAANVPKVEALIRAGPRL